MKTNRLFDYWRRKEKEREEFKRREREDSLFGNMTSSVALQTSINCSTRICPLNCETKELKRHLVYNLRQTWRDTRGGSIAEGSRGMFCVSTARGYRG